ncbi:MAG: DUF4920 domain-containing protein [Pyrinomonadaceae bacterium]
MKRILGLLIVTLAFSAAILAQDSMEGKKQPTDADKIAKFDSNGKIKRGEAIGKSKKVKLSKVLANPEKYTGKDVRVTGYVVRSCKNEGCWAELGETKDATKTVRVKMKDHAFFIPLQSVGFKVLTEGTFSVKTLSKEEVEHLQNEDGAKFDNINTDGTVTEVTFVATGIELSK